MKESYLIKAFVEHAGERDGDRYIREGVDKIGESLNKLILQFHAADFPLIVAALETCCASISKKLNANDARLVKSLKGAMMCEAIKIDVSEFKRQADELKRSKDGKNE